MSISIRNMILSALFASLTAIGAIFFTIPIGPVPVTLQILFTTLAGVLLGSRLGALSQIIYICMGLAGMPVFSGGKGGIGQLASPTFGYLTGFVACAYFIGFIVERMDKVSFIKLFAACTAGISIVYLTGFPYLYLVLTKINGIQMNAGDLFKSAVLVFLPGDIFKIIVTSLIGAKIMPILKRMEN